MVKRSALVLLIAIAFASCETTVMPAVSNGPQPGSDEFQIQSTVLAVYNVISGPAGRRDWDRFKDLFAPGARMISMHKEPVVMTTDEYIAKTTPYFKDNAFFERPIDTKIDRFQDIATVRSRYESRHASSDEKPFTTGVNEFQLVRSGDSWKVMTILWQEEPH